MTNGLSNDEVIEKRKKYGTNEIIRTRKNTFFHLFIETLGDPIIKILLIVLAVKVIFLFRHFDIFETIGIAVAILVASLISTISEYGSEKAFVRLQEESSKIKCRVKRNGKVEEINIDEVVMDDIALLSSGDKIPSDGIIVSGSITVDESMMNGETKEQYKEKAINLNNVKDNNLVYRGTVVYDGHALMKVNKIGADTLYGKLASELEEKALPSPLKLRLNKLAKTISKLGYIAAILVSISYLFSNIVIENNFNITKIIDTVTNIPLLFGYLLEALTLSVTVIVVAVPEGLPMMITLVLSSNMKRMLKNNVLVRKLVGIETAGSLNILFTDKTGTLTKGKLEVINMISGDNLEINNSIELNNYPKYKELVLDNLVYNNDSIYDPVENKIIGGNITDKSLLEFIKIKKNNDIKELYKLPFNSKNKYSITIISKDNKNIKLVKGAPEKILKYTDLCYDKYGNKMLLKEKDKILSKIDNMTKNGIRAIAIANSDNTVNKDSLNNIVLIGILFIKDEIRNESKDAIRLVKDAGIQTVMITGDSKNTALSIGSEIGLINSDNDLVITSDELNLMSDDKVKQILPRLKIVSRALPSDKSRLVRLAQELNLVVGMTGDGVNDAPALKKADVGFAMGSGTEVAKEASDIVIIDNNFLSITKAILYGRTIFKSIRKFIIFQLTVNLCAVSVSIIGPFIGIPYPVTVIQMLWINMVMDTLAGLAFSYESPKLEYMKEPPKKKDENIINNYMLNEILVTGIYSSLLCFIFLKSHFIRSFFRYSPSYEYLLTAFFGLFIFISIFNSFNARTHRLNLFTLLHKNKVFLSVILFVAVVQIYLIYYGGDIFRTRGLTLNEFIIMLLISFTVIPFDFIRKLYLKSIGKNTGV